jgi:hypothetical protein
MADSLKYAAGTVLTCAAITYSEICPFHRGSFLHQQPRLFQQPLWVFVFVAERGFQFTDMFVYHRDYSGFLNQRIFTGTLCHSRKAHNRKACQAEDAATVRSVSFCVLSATVLISLADVTLIAEISAGRLVAIIFVMCAACGAVLAWAARGRINGHSL